MTNQEYEKAIRALLQTPDMKKWTCPMRPGREGHIHPCELCGVVCKVASSWETGDTMEQHSAPCGAMCGRGLYHGANPHLAASCPNCKPLGSIKGDSIPSE